MKGSCVQKFFLIFAVVFGLSVVAHAGQGAPATAAPTQPIPFNHQQHVQGAKMTCNSCHEPRNDGDTLTIPQPAKCMSCHTTVAADKPDIQRIAEAAKNEDSIPWVRVYRVPSFVTFSHKTHSGSTCEECHGPVAERVAIAPEKDMHMGSCIACHASKGARTTCDTCHAIMSKNGNFGGTLFDATVLARFNGRPVVPATGKSNTSNRPTHQLASLATFLYAPTL
jgi:Cytochrome c7 and related cytochrome c/Class III cytochrome C family